MWWIGRLQMRRKTGSGSERIWALVLTKEIVAVDVPEFVIVNMTFSDLLTGDWRERPRFAGSEPEWSPRSNIREG